MGVVSTVGGCGLLAQCVLYKVFAFYMNWCKRHITLLYQIEVNFCNSDTVVSCRCSSVIDSVSHF